MMWSFLKRHWRISAIAGCLVIAAAGFAWAQGIVAPIQANGQPGAIPATITLNNARATTSYQLSNATTGTVTANALANRIIFTASTLGSVTLNAPANPPDGSMIEIVNGTGAAFTTGVTLATTDGSTLVGSASSGALPAGASVEWQYVANGAKWYKLR